MPSDGVVLACVGIYVAPGAMALEGLAIFLQVFVVVGDDFFGRVVGDELRRHHFQRESRERKVYIGALLVVAAFFRSGLGAGIEGQAGVANVGLFADVQIAYGRLDVN